MLSNTYNIKDFTKTELFDAPTMEISGQLDLIHRTLTAKYNGNSFIFIANNTEAELKSLVFYARNSRAINRAEENRLYSLVCEQFEGVKVP
ncbi:hypothetical protein [Lactococcus lactis]|uniref:hypothetical protein n=1 Tax=Lactococcus lactis TaxID=1358 RepID=UPI00223C4DB1|nr:hypothetical protein [Lactococcus lactis]MCT0449983.1 hypothetical protein [Lactococcus lactis subsp. lactis]